MLRVAVSFHGEPYWLNVSACRRALVCRRAAGDVRGVGDVAAQAGVSRATASRFFNGHRGGWTIETVTAILQILRLRFEDVVTHGAEGP